MRPWSSDGARATGLRARGVRLTSPTGGSAWRRAAVGLSTLVFGGAALTVTLAAAAPARHVPPDRVRDTGAAAASDTSAPPPFAVGLRVLRLVDRSRTVRLRDDSSEPRSLVTYVRYPALGASDQVDVRNAPAASVGRPYPLIVFGHGFAVTPQRYARLLQSWARAGFLVAAPAFPLTNANAPGGPDEADVINQPADMSFVISSMLSLSQAATGPLAGLIDPAQIAVAGHSDGAETALAVAYGRRFHDPRVGAAVILSGAEMSKVGGYRFPPGSPSLLAAQGTADTFNEPKYTDAYFDLARRPKFLLRLLGAGHLPPYTYQQPQLAIIERVTLAFLDTYLKHEPGGLEHLVSQGSVAGRSALVARP
jgi:dienelactone hydrolase